MTIYRHTLYLFSLLYCWCMFLIHLPFHVLFLFSLYTHASYYFVCNLLFLFHTKMPWWVLFKVFQKYKLSKSTCHKLSFCKVFQEFVLGYILLYSTSEYKLSDLWLLSYVHILRTYVMILCNWFILWQNALYLYLGRLRMCLNTSRNYVSRSSVEAFKSVQEIK